MTICLSKSLFLTFLLAGLGAAQSAPAPVTASQLSPEAAYDEVMRPLEITRRSVANWSDSEKAALGIAVIQAAEACTARAPEQFNGDGLLAFARLCSAGQQWPVVGAAATRYLTSADQGKPQLAQAYAYQVTAALHMDDPKTILASSQAMLHAVPYNNLTDETVSGALHYLQLAYTREARTLYIDREIIVLKTLRDPQPGLPPVSPEMAAVPIHTLYADGVAFAAFEQFDGELRGAVGVLAELDAALPATLQPDDAIPIADSRRQYALLGTPLPHIPLTLSLFDLGETPRIDTDYGASTVLLLFPDWCAQCVRMAGRIPPTLSRTREHGVHLYGLLAQPAPPVTTPPKTAMKTKLRVTPTPEPEPAKKPAEQLRGTPTLIVPPATLEQFAAVDFPLLIATDPKGTIRFIQPAGEDALNPGDFLDQITAHIAEQWPREPAVAPHKP